MLAGITYCRTINTIVVNIQKLIFFFIGSPSTPAQSFHAAGHHLWSQRKQLIQVIASHDCTKTNRSQRAPKTKKAFSRNYSILIPNFSYILAMESRVTRLVGKELWLWKSPLIRMCYKGPLSYRHLCQALPCWRLQSSFPLLACSEPPEREVVRGWGGGGYLSRLGAHTRARFRACMLVWLLKEAMWARCRIKYSKVL